LKTLINVVAIMALAAGSARAAPQCGSRDLRAVLSEQGFTGAFGDGGDSLQRLGVWGERHTQYLAYWYEHVDRSRSAGHAVRSVIVLDRACRYLGRYAVNPSKPHVRGRVIYFSDVSPADGNRIVLTAKGPPQQAWIDGENPELAK
jgi:hypothetical protein